MATRLDRLFALLESGSNAGTRRAAAVQLGEVQKVCPYELKNLLSRLLSLLRNASWDTRVAAGQALAAVAQNVAPWSPVGCADVSAEDATQSGDLAPGKMRFADFDVDRMIAQGAQLLGSEGREYDCDGSADPRDAQAKRAVLNEQIGLGGFAEKAGLSHLADDMVHDDDLVVMPPSYQNDSYGPARMSLRNMWNTAPSVSVRERNRMKRKLKTSYSRTMSVDETSDIDSNGSMRKRRSVDELRSFHDDPGMDSADSTDSTLDSEPSEWPFTQILEELCGDLFHSDWRIRHGAATGIREIIRTHGGAVGKTTGLAASQMSLVNDRWLEDVALRLLCVLALDRFGDFVSYEVVAPVRETCAQALGAVVKWLSLTPIGDVVTCLLKLIHQQNWQTRHGGLLGLKYVLVVRQNLVRNLLPVVYPAVFTCLKDAVDDVCAVAAAVLEAVMDEFLVTMPHEVSNTLTLLWNGLLEFDDLTSWTKSFMSLLSTIVTKSEPAYFLTTRQPLGELLPRLWPFLDHSSDRIRISVLQTVETLIGTSDKTGGAHWLPVIIPDLMRRLYQRCIVEDKASVHPYLISIWKACLFFSPISILLELFLSSVASWMCLAMQSPSGSIDPSLFGVTLRDTMAKSGSAEKQLFFAGSDSSNDPSADRDVSVIRTRFLAAQLIGAYAGKILNDAEDGHDALAAETLSTLLQFHLRSKSAVQKFEAAMVTLELSKLQLKSANSRSVLLDTVRTVLKDNLEETMPYDELALSITTMHAACVGLAQQLHMAGADIEPDYLTPVLTLRQCQTLVSTQSQRALDSLSRKDLKGNLNIVAMLSYKRTEAATATQLASTDFVRLSSRVHLGFAAALVGLHYIPQKLAPLVRPLMDTLKENPNCLLQDCAANTMAELMTRIHGTAPATCEKIAKNLCSYLCCDSSLTPDIKNPLSDSPACDLDFTLNKDVGIFSLIGGAKERTCSKTVTYGNRKIAPPVALPPGTDGSAVSAIVIGEQSLDIQRAGAELALRAICLSFGAALCDNLPQLTTDRMLKPIVVGLSTAAQDGNLDTAKEVVSALQVFEKMIPFIHEELHETVMGVLDYLGNGVGHRFTAVRHLTGRVVAAISTVCEESAIRFLAKDVLPILSSDELRRRQGAIETVGYVIEQLGMGVVPYIVLLTVPVMRRMTDQDEAVRIMASQCFGTLVRLMPLGFNAPKSPKSQWFVHQPEEVKFLEQLLDSSKMEQFVSPVKINAELRSYQQDGLNWLNFLNRYNLHGILCDDMGLGKTLQTICILAADHYRRAKEIEKNGSANSAHLPSLVICPATLIGHWAQEVSRFIDDRNAMKALKYEGCPADRFKLRKSVKDHALIISSYDIVKNDADFFREMSWNYCVLDEGHVIRNNKTKVFKVIKQLVCSHRLILSGTPVQNNVQDLWALFDFLMPGLLGTEKKFASRFARAIEASKDPKASSQDIEEGALAMETLHKQVLPFILRRLKVDVLKDLPPKIIQDYYCDLSPIQLRLYEDFAKSKVQKDVLNSLLGANGTASATSGGATGHVFQAFQYLRKVCNHPSLVVNKQHPQYTEITRDLEKTGSSITDIQHAAKFVALQQLLLDCGIGQDATEQNVVSSHRALIFCQLTAVLDLIEHDLLRYHMPTVTYLKLDGSVPARDRQKVVDRFNSDPSIDVLLLTTAIGGLGLNLTGADTVIFVEHDWNPSKDIQAMDRAHRIGQKRVVNVYRLITRGTIEEKIMGLQKFKLHMANSVITQENSTLQTMGTEQIVDLFSVDSGSTGGSGQLSGKGQSMKPPVKGLKAVLDNLEDLWDSSQYDSEYDVGRFMDALKK